MAGGTFSSMNKTRPGAYINFNYADDSIIYTGERGIVSMAMALPFGEEDKIIEVTAAEMANGSSLSKIGLINSDAEALPINLALQNCQSVKLYNINKTMVKASATLENGLVVTAKNGGTFGNKIAILIKSAENLFNVETYADGYFVDSQVVSRIADLVDNNFVTFSGTGTLSATESTLLSGGTNGTEMQSSEYLPKYQNLLKTTKFNVAACLTDSASDKSSFEQFAQDMVNEEGKYIQVVVSNSSTADYEGIINLVNGVVLNDETQIPANIFTSWVAGATAGASATESLAGKVVNNAVAIVNPLDNNAIIEGIQNGKFILSLNQDGGVKVEKDINSLHTYNSGKKYEFSKNRVIRELYRICTDITSIWETTYLGKVTANEAGRTLLKSSIINYLTDLNTEGAIQNFDANTVQVEAGDDIDSVVASIAVQPLDSMELLYMTINII